MDFIARMPGESHCIRFSSLLLCSCLWLILSGSWLILLKGDVLSLCLCLCLSFSFFLSLSVSLCLCLSVCLSPPSFSPSLLSTLCAPSSLTWSKFNIDRFYIALFSALEQTHRALITLFNIHRSGVLVALFGCYMAGATWNRCCIGALSVHTIQPCTSLQYHFTQSHIRRVYARLAVTCCRHFWQNDRELLLATAITQVERMPK